MLDRDDARQLERVVELVRDVLGPELLGAYLFGSAVLGGLKPESDLDVLAVSARPLTPEERRRLVERLLAISDRPTDGGRSRRLELTVVVGPDVRPWRYPPRMDFQYGDWLRRDLERGELAVTGPAANPDLAVLLTMAVEADHPLAGPPPADVLGAVPRHDLVRASVDCLEPLQADLDTDTRNVLLTLARIWSTVETGEIRSKDAAADWALPRLPEPDRPVLARARALYLEGRDGRWDGDFDRVGRLAALIVATVRAEAGAFVENGT